MSIKIVFARVICFLVAMVALMSSLSNIFVPESQLQTALLIPQGIAGYSNFRVGMGAPFLAAGLFAAYAAFRVNRQALVPVVVFFACVLFARIVGFVADGVDPVSIPFTGLAAAILVFVSGAYWIYGQAEAAET